MNEIINQFRRIFNDDGRNDKDFSKEERRLHEAQQFLRAATLALEKASEALKDISNKVYTKA